MGMKSGRRKWLTILGFIGPTLLGILVFNIYPIVYNTYISFTNRNQTHTAADCTVFLTNIIEPTCWPAFRDKAPLSMADPFRIMDPVFGNYIKLFGSLFNLEGLWAIFRLLLCFVPLLVANVINKRLDRQLTRSVNSLVVWAGGGVVAVLLAFLVNFGDAITVLQTSSDFFVVVFRTVLYVAACIPLFFILGLILALILNSKYIKFKTFFRSVMIIPWAASTMAVMMSLIWQFFFRDRGTLNQVLTSIGIESSKAWLQDPFWAFAIVVLVNLWYSYPFFFSLILSALQSIPTDQFEAADLDGASYWQQLLHIVLPLIRPAVLPAVVLSSISTFQMFGTVWAITQGGPTRGAGTPGATEMVMIYAYKQVFQSNAYGLAGAFAVIIFIFLFAATLYSMRMTRITKGAYE
jgi:arabinogalactan oligomer / maltooligosaccharide transport system permease protein